MRAVQFSAFGKPSQLRLVELPDPQPDARNAVVKVIASSVNPSDVKNVAGAMEGTVLPRVPGRDFSGIVEHGPADWQGAEVWGAGGDIGFARDGAHAERLLFPVAALRRKPHNLSHEQASAIGVNFLIAWLGAITYAKLEAGDEVAVIGVSGGVGGAVTQLAKARGARVIGFDRTPPAHDAPAAKLLDRFELTNVDVVAAVRDFTHGRGASLVFDAVGGPMFDTRCARPRIADASSSSRRPAGGASTSICSTSFTTRRSSSAPTAARSTNCTRPTSSSRCGAVSNWAPTMPPSSPNAMDSRKPCAPTKRSKAGPPDASSSPRKEYRGTHRPRRFVLVPGAAAEFERLIVDNATRSVSDEPGCLRFTCSARRPHRTRSCSTKCTPMRRRSRRTGRARTF